MSTNTKPHKTGKQIQTKVLAYLKQHKDIVAYKIEVANERGVPDILLCIKGHFVAMEIKGHGDKLSGIQTAQLERIRDAYGLAFVVDSFDKFMMIINNVSLREGF